jgi:hypothetical protein
VRRLLWLVLYVHLCILVLVFAAVAVGAIVFGILASPWFFFALPAGVTLAVLSAMGAGDCADRAESW